jgi:hypothetical protein
MKLFKKSDHLIACLRQIALCDIIKRFISETFDNLIVASTQDYLYNVCAMWEWVLFILGGGGLIGLYWKCKGMYREARNDLIEAIWLPPAVRTDARILTYKNLSDEQLIEHAERRMYDDYVDDVIQMEKENRDDLRMLIYNEKKAIEAIFRCLERFRQVKRFWLYRPKDYLVWEVFSKKGYKPNY